VMPERMWKKLGIPIDMDINWKIGGYREGAEAEQGKGLLGVCHDVKMTIGGVHFKVPVFIVEGGASDLILGRPWELEGYYSTAGWPPKGFIYRCSWQS